MQTKLIQNNSKNLIIFLTGWGCDSDQFKFMYSKENDVLIVYDYSNLDFDATQIQKKMADPENLKLVRDVLTKLG